MSNSREGSALFVHWKALKQQKWTSGEKEYLRTLLNTEESRDNVAQKFEKFNNGRSSNALRICADVCKMKCHFKHERWTAEQDDYIRVLKTDGIPSSEWTEYFRGKFGLQRTRAAFRSRFHALGICHTPGWIPWSEEEGKFVTELIASNVKEPREICDRFWKRFGTERIKKSIYAKYEYLRDRGETSGARKAPLWSSDEDRFIKEWSSRPKDLIAAFPQKFGRTDGAVFTGYWVMQARKREEEIGTFGDIV
ncbi:hypothetical protein AAE478_006545 [Parahypoxylon ruwenzoriense]